MFSIIIWFILIILIIGLLGANVVIVPQAQVKVVERLGRYSATWHTGIHIKIPFLERIVREVSMKEQVADFPPQPVITKDNVTMQIDTVIYFQISYPEQYTYLL